MNHSYNENDSNFSNDEYVDLIDPKTGNSYEGRIIAIKGEEILVENLKTRKEKLYKKMIKE